MLTKPFPSKPFRPIHKITPLNYGEFHWQAYGNMQFLDNPFKRAVICHRAEEKIPEIARANRNNWYHTAENGGVLVSAFIAEASRGAPDMAIPERHG